jgi:DNA polymerase III subunit beta
MSSSVVSGASMTRTRCGWPGPLLGSFGLMGRLIRRLLPQPARYRVSEDLSVLRRGLAVAPTRRVVRERDGQVREVSVLAVCRKGLSVADPSVRDQRGGLRIGVDRRYLLQAVDALGCDRLVLAVDGPVAPLMLRPEGSARTLSVLMPVRV